MKKILLFILIFISIISCSQKEKVLDEKSRKEDQRHRKYESF